MKHALILLMLLVAIQVTSYSQPCNDPCELIGNSNFNDLSSNIYAQPTFPFYPSTVSCWMASHGSPHLPQFPGCTSGPPDLCFEDYVSLEASWNGLGEGIFQDVNIIAGHKYIITIEYKVPQSNTYDVDRTYFKLINYPSSWTTNSPPGWATVGAAPSPTSSMQLNLLAGTQPIPFNWNWKGACFAFEADANYQALWIYTEQIFSSHGPASIHIKNIHIREVTAGPDVTICSGGSINLGDGCTNVGPYYQFQWSPTTGLNNPYSPNPTVTLTNTGTTPITQTYTISTDNCVGVETDQVTVTIDPQIPVTATTPNGTICSGQNATLNATGGVTYNWQPGNLNGSTVSVNPTATTTYTVTGTAANGCTGTSTVTVNVIDVTKPVILSDFHACPGETITYTIDNFNPSYSYAWNVNGGTLVSVSPSGNSATITWSNTPGAYVLSVSTTTNGNPSCTAVNNFTVYVDSPPAAPSISGFLQTCAYPSATYTITNYDNTVDYTWTATGGTITGGNTGQSVDISWTGGGGQIDILAVSTVTGCTTTVSIPIAPCCEPPGGGWLTTYTGNYDYSSQMIVFNGGITVTQKDLAINDIFYVDQDINFANCHIYMGPGAKIVVAPGKKLHIDDVSLVEACGDMWDGIYVSGGTTPNPEVRISNSTVKDARNAVITTGGPIVNLFGTQFINNYVGAFYNFYNGASPGTIIQCTFTQNGTLRPPYNGQTALCGILLNNIHQIQIGKDQNSYDVNHFSNMMFGVYSQNSYYSIVNNDFTGFNSTMAGNPFVGAAIYSIGSGPNTIFNPNPNAPNPNAGYIGKTAWNTSGAYKKNVFSKNLKGVVLLGAGQMDIYDNDFIDHDEISIWSVWGQKNMTIRITDNDISNNAFTNNTIAGISALESSLNYSARYYVQNNTITNTRQGINMLNALKPRILQNTIGLLEPVSGQPWSWGILDRGTNGADIQNNVVVGPATGANTIGIFSEVAPKVIEKCNITYGVWVGLQNAGPSADSRYTCNQMLLNGAGYFNLNGYMGNQFNTVSTNPSSAENQWVACGYNLANAFTGTIPTLDTWYTRPFGPYATDQPGAGGNNFSFNGVLYEASVTWDLGPSYYSCGCQPGAQIQVPPVPPLTEEEIETLQKNFLTTISTTLGIKPDYATWMEKDALYKELVNDTLPITDADLLAFKNQTEMQNIGKLQKGSKGDNDHANTILKDSIPSTVVDSLKSVAQNLKDEQAAIAPNNLLEYYSQLLNTTKLEGILQAYLNKQQRNLSKELLDNPFKNPFEILFPFDQTQLDKLVEVALQCPYTTGTSVYDARALLKVLTGQDYFNECEFFDMGMLIRNDVAEGMEPEMILYPNPANSFVSIDPVIENPEEGYLQIMDATGRMVLEQTVLEYPIVIDISNLQSGSYVVIFNHPGRNTQFKKLLIAR